MTVAAGPSLAESGLRFYGELIGRAVTSFLPGGRPAEWLYDLVVEYPRRGGKALRPSLCLATCEAFGGHLEECLPSAAAIEILHNAFLVHDDIEDSSRLRRGEPTLHRAHGVALALNAGDALAVLAQRALRSNATVLGGRMAARVADEFDIMARRTLEGQAIELGWSRDRVVDLGPDDYLALVMRKTSWYTTVHPLRVGALIGTWGAVDPAPLVRFGLLLGAAFQIRDDLLNLDGDEQAYGKEILGDLLEGKRTLMMIHLLSQLRGAARADLVAYLGLDRSHRSLADADHVLDLMRAAGSLDFARAFSGGIAREAEAAYEPAFGAAAHSEAGRFVLSLVPFMVERGR
ncbi:MAG: polyprenyl synthetase family protein [Acidimicrobiales bacterium]